MKNSTLYLSRVLAAFLPIKGWRKKVRRCARQRTITRLINGTGNKLYLSDPENPNLSIYIYGNDNVVSITARRNFSATIYIGSVDSPAQHCCITIGAGTISAGPVFIRLMEDHSSVSIGRDCMFSSDVHIHGSDTHCIFDSDGNLLNIGRRVEIGDHVWLGQYSKILKNSSIPDGCIIGMAAIVAGRFSDPGCVIAGCPARIVKRGVGWDRMRPQQFLRLHPSR